MEKSLYCTINKCYHSETFIRHCMYNIYVHVFERGNKEYVNVNKSHILVLFVFVLGLYENHIS